MEAKEITTLFHHNLQPPEDAVVIKITTIEEAYQALGHCLNAQLGDSPSRERSLVFTKLQESFLFALNILTK